MDVLIHNDKCYMWILIVKSVLFGTILYADEYNWIVCT